MITPETIEVIDDQLMDLYVLRYAFIHIDDPCICDKNRFCPKCESNKILKNEMIFSRVKDFTQRLMNTYNPSDLP